jgi:hypothetical protein
MPTLLDILMCWSVALMVELPIVFLFIYIARDKE